MALASAMKIFHTGWVDSAGSRLDPVRSRVNPDDSHPVPGHAIQPEFARQGSSQKLFCNGANWAISTRDSKTKLIYSERNILFVSALYFPQSDFMLRIPYVDQNEVGLSYNMKLITIRVLQNDSTIPKDPKYQIVLPREKFASLDIKTGNVVLETLPKGGKFFPLFLRNLNFM